MSYPTQACQFSTVSIPHFQGRHILTQHTQRYIRTRHVRCATLLKSANERNGIWTRIFVPEYHCRPGGSRRMHWGLRTHLRQQEEAEEPKWTQNPRDMGPAHEIMAKSSFQARHAPRNEDTTGIQPRQTPTPRQIIDPRYKKEAENTKSPPHGRGERKTSLFSTSKENQGKGNATQRNAK